MLKRDDLFAPRGLPVSGGKLRQCLALIEADKASHVVSAGTMHSPQVGIVAYGAAVYGRQCTVFVGGSAETPATQFAAKMGARVVRRRFGRNSVLFAEAKRVAATGDGMLIPYGFRVSGDDTPSAVTARQVENLPDCLDLLVIPCGSGGTATGVLTGLVRFHKCVSRVLIVATGPHRMKSIEASVGMTLTRSMRRAASPWGRIDYHSLFHDPGFRYERPEPLSFEGIELHPRYEAKVMRWFVRRARRHPSRTLFWIVGGPGL